MLDIWRRYNSALIIDLVLRISTLFCNLASSANERRENGGESAGQGRKESVVFLSGQGDISRRLGISSCSGTDYHEKLSSFGLTEWTEGAKIESRKERTKGTDW